MFLAVQSYKIIFVSIGEFGVNKNNNKRYRANHLKYKHFTDAHDFYYFLTINILKRTYLSTYGFLLVIFNILNNCSFKTKPYS